MICYKLNRIRSIVKEVQRLEKLMSQYQKSSIYKEEFYKNFNECKEEKSMLCKEDLLKDLPLRNEERELAKKYYYEGLEWEDAHFQVFGNTERGDVLFSDLSGKKAKKDCKYYQKSIMRKIQQFYDYGKKKSESGASVGKDI